MSDDLDLLEDLDTQTNGHDMTEDKGDEAAGQETDASNSLPDHFQGKLTVSMVHTALNDYGYICDRQLATQVFMALNTDPMAGAFLKGPPGAGKTMLPEVLADIFGMEYYFRQATPETREGQLLMDLWPDEDTKAGIRKIEGPITKAVRASHERPSLLLIDEWDKTKPSADAFLLDFLQHGRINAGDINLTADLSNLVVFLTMNDERDLSGPLRRRMPFIEFTNPHPSLVKKALIDSHGAHPYIPALVELYIRGTLSNMDKPVTVQELRQILSQAITLGEDADWNLLVRQYVTKSDRNHQMLQRAESRDVSDWESTMGKDVDGLDPERYGTVEIGSGSITDEDISSSMPKLAEVKELHDRRNTNDAAPDLSTAYAVMRNTDDVYNEVTKLHDPGDSPDQVGWARVEGENITFEEAIPLDELSSADGLWGSPGEVMFSEEDATFEDMLTLRGRGLTFTSYSKEEVIGTYQNGMVDIRWTPEDGAEIIANLMEREIFQEIISPWIYFHPEPTEVMARLGVLDEGIIQRRKEGVGDPTVYFASVSDEWGSNGHDYIKEIKNLEGFDDFVKLVQKKGRVVKVPETNSSYYLFDNVLFGFLGEMNDEFALSITGEVDADVVPFIKKWARHSKVLLKRTVDFGGDPQDLLDDHGFEITSKERIRKIGKGYAAAYRDDGSIRIGSRLQGTKLTPKRINSVIKAIRKAEKDLTSDLG